MSPGTGAEGLGPGPVPTAATGATGATGPTGATGGTHAASSTGELVSRLSQDVSQLIRDELRLAQAEVSGKAKKAGLGAGMFGAAGVLALYGGGVLITTVILALDLAMPAWLAALIVGVVLLAAAGVAALLGKRRVAEAAPPVPTRAMDSVKQDVAAVRQAAHHEH